MAQKRLIFCLPCVGSHLHFLRESTLMPSSLLVPFRGKKQKAKKQKKMKKDPRLLEMKEYAQRMEVQKMMLSATMKAAKKGEPLDPEMLNPVRKRAPPTLPKEVKDQRFLLTKEWSRYQMQLEVQRRHFLQGVVQSREKALRELKRASSSLYAKALELNSELFPWECQGPTETPPIPSYTPPDPES